MTKKILPTMIGVALAGGMTAASADVTVFGHIDESVLYSDITPNSSVPGFDGSDTNLVCTTCSIGFKGSEDLGNGLKAIFKLDFQYDINNRNSGAASVAGNTTTITSPPLLTTGGGTYTLSGNVVTSVSGSSSSSSIIDRDQWIGLAGGFGQVRIGTISTSYKSHGAMLDPGYRTVAQMRDHGIMSNLHSGAGEEGQGRATNTFRWDSPDYSGVKVTAHYTLDSNEGDGEDDNPWGLGASYENGGLLVFADYITNDTGGSDDAWKLGGRFSISNFAVFAQYENDGGLISSKAAGSNRDGADVWMLGGSATFGSNTVYAAYGTGDDDNNASNGDQGYDAWEIVGVHSMSKNTLVYAGYVNRDEDKSTYTGPTSGSSCIPVSCDGDGIERDHFTVGVKHKF
jgi:predicted porin